MVQNVRKSEIRERSWASIYLSLTHPPSTPSCHWSCQKADSRKESHFLNIGSAYLILPFIQTVSSLEIVSHLSCQLQVRKTFTPKAIWKCKMIPWGCHFPEEQWPQWLTLDFLLLASLKRVPFLYLPLGWGTGCWLCVKSQPAILQGALWQTRQHLLVVWVAHIIYGICLVLEERGQQDIPTGCQLLWPSHPFGPAPPPCWSFLLIFFEIWSLLDLQQWPAARNKSHIKTMFLF